MRLIFVRQNGRKSVSSSSKVISTLIKIGKQQGMSLLIISVTVVVGIAQKILLMFTTSIIERLAKKREKMLWLFVKGNVIKNLI